MYRPVTSCRLCRSPGLRPILDLGMMSMTGVFPKSGETVGAGPVGLSHCPQCDLVQMSYSYNLNEMYGQNYGYRSGLNGSMVRHLNHRVQRLLRFVDLQSGDLVLDIGSNDGTLLRAYPDRGLQFVGMDPSAGKFRQYYPSDVTLIEDFFSGAKLQERIGSKKARVVTSIAMFYDLEDPQAFVNDVANTLAPNGVWVFEQSYLKAMFDTTSYDTICHEHLEYYGVKQIERMLSAAGLKILDIEFNDVNGGSFAVTAALRESPMPEARDLVLKILEAEDREGLYSARMFDSFVARVEAHKRELVTTLRELRDRGKRVIGYGASTKGNVLLQYCGLTSRELICIAEVNEDKFGRFTPGSDIPIVSEASARKMAPDYFFVLPWHFKSGIVNRESEFLRSGGKILFPLPTIQVVEGPR